jgi:hypothetical protein
MGGKSKKLIFFCALTAGRRAARRDTLPSPNTPDSRA